MKPATSAGKRRVGSRVVKPGGEYDPISNDFAIVRFDPKLLGGSFDSRNGASVIRRPVPLYLFDRSGEQFVARDLLRDGDNIMRILHHRRTAAAAARP